MKIGIISDSHDHHQNVLKAVEVFKKHQVKYILHAGDIISPFAAKAFADVKAAEFIAVYGNNDGEKLFLKKKIEEFGGRIYEDTFKGEIQGRKILMTHKPDLVEETAASGCFDLVIYGHTHKKDIRKVGATLVVNPGETTDWISDRSDVVILELDDLTYEVISLR
jgi:putative phosphoesterase